MIPMTAGFGGPDEGLLRQHKAFSYDGQFQDQGLAGAFSYEDGVDMVS